MATPTTGPDGAHASDNAAAGTGPVTAAADPGAADSDGVAELARLNDEVTLLTARAQQACQIWYAADASLRATLQRRD